MELSGPCQKEHHRSQGSLKNKALLIFLKRLLLSCPPNCLNFSSDSATEESGKGIHGSFTRYSSIQR